MIQIKGTSYEARLNNIWDNYYNVNKNNPSWSSSQFSYNIRESNIFPGASNRGATLNNFVIPREIEKNTILFIGLNPSVITYKKGRNNVPYLFNTNLQFEDIYSTKSVVVGFHNGGVADIDYFEKINDLCEEINKPTTIYEKFSYLDLFQVRVTADDAIKWALEHHSKTDKSGNPLYSGLTNFLQEQLNLCHDLINEVNPPLIVVNNATASKFILGNTYSLSSPLLRPVKDPQIGTYRVQIKNKYIPIFFTRMMSSGGLDEGSFDRLAWHIRNVFKMNSCPPMYFT